MRTGVPLHVEVHVARQEANTSYKGGYKWELQDLIAHVHPKFCNSSLHVSTKIKKNKKNFCNSWEKNRRKIKKMRKPLSAFANDLLQRCAQYVFDQFVCCLIIFLLFLFLGFVYRWVSWVVWNVHLIGKDLGSNWWLGPKSSKLISRSVWCKEFFFFGYYEEVIFGWHTHPCTHPPMHRPEAGTRLRTNHRGGSLMLQPLGLMPALLVQGILCEKVESRKLDFSQRNLTFL